MKFEPVKDYFDNGYNVWDGLRCPKCQRIFDINQISTVRDLGGDNEDYRLVCPACGFVEGEKENI